MAPKVGFPDPFCGRISLGKFGVGDHVVNLYPMQCNSSRVRIQGQRTPSPI